MLRLDQLGDDLCDSLGQLQFVSVEVHAEISPLGPFHSGVIDQQQLCLSRHKNMQGEHHSNGDWPIASNVATGQRKIFNNSFTSNSIPEVAHRRECLEPLTLP